jgi:hypothetical protein
MNARVLRYSRVVTNMRIKATRPSVSVSPLCINTDGCSRVRVFCSEGVDAIRCRQTLLYATEQKLKEARSWSLRPASLPETHDSLPSWHALQPACPVGAAAFSPSRIVRSAPPSVGGKPENGARAGGVLLTVMCAVTPRRMMLCVFH